MKIEYNNLYTHFVFTSMHRQAVIHEKNRIRATIIADSSERFINEHNLLTGRFEWQKTASAFSVSKSDVDKICKYIINQPAHHKKKNFEEEYQTFIKYYQTSIKKE